MLPKAVKKGDNLTATGIRSKRFSSMTAVDDFPLDRGCWQRQVGHHLVEVDFQRIGTGLLNQHGVGSQASAVVPFNEAITGTWTACLTRRRCSR